MHLSSLIFGALFCFISVSLVSAHDLITDEVAKQYLLELQESVSVLEDVGASNEMRAQSALSIGAKLEEIKSFLNRDISMHGAINGLATEYLVSKLESSGMALHFDSKNNYYPSDNSYYHTALKFASSNETRSLAKVRLIKGDFYHDFQGDLMSTTASLTDLEGQVKSFNDVDFTSLSNEEAEELRFIKIITYARLMKGKRNDEDDRLSKLFQALSEEFEMLYPSSMRLGAVSVVKEILNVH
jgi:hypothetical protein